MPAVYVSRISQWIEKHFNAKGGSVITDVDPTALVELPFLIGAEDRYLQGWNIYAAGAVQSAVAANFSAVNIRNPNTSNVVAVLERIFFAASIAQQVDLAVAGFPNGGDLAGSVSGRPRVDGRIAVGPSSVVTRDAPAADPETGYLVEGSIFVPAGTPFDWILTHDQELVLTPGINVRIINRTVNANLYVTLFWRERPMEQSELT